MKHLLQLTATMMTVCALICLTSTQALAQKENADTQAEATWVGEIVDLNCYITKGAKGPDHAGCAKACVKGGQPMGLLTDDGTLVLLAKDNGNKEAFETLKEMAGENASVTGKLNERDGINMLVVQSAAKP